MKKLLLIICLSVAVPVAQQGCASSPSTQNTQVQTLKAVGHAAEATVALSAQLYSQGVITAPQARQVMDLYNFQFQKAFGVAVIAAHYDITSIASDDLVKLSVQLANLVTEFQKK